MTVRTDLLAELAELDPAITTDRPETWELALDRVLARTGGLPEQAPPRRAGRRSWRMAALVATTAAVAAVVLPSVLSGSSTAAWSAVPRLDPQAASRAEAACTRHVGELASRVPAELRDADVSRMRPVITDVRGSAVLVLMADGRSELTCLYDGTVVTGSGGVIDDRPSGVDERPGPGGIWGYPGAILSYDSSSLRAVTGEVGPDVAEVVLETTASGPVTASVADGHFAAWWPDPAVSDEREDSSSPGDELRYLTVTTRDGASHRVSVPDFLRVAG